MEKFDANPAFSPTPCNISIETVPLIDDVKRSIAVKVKYNHNFHLDSSLEINSKK